MRAMSFASPRQARHGLLLLLAVVTFAALAAGPIADPAPVEASKASNMEARILDWINDARRQRDLEPLRKSDKLKNFAGDRARHMANTNEMEHVSCLSCALNSRNVDWDRCGEVIAYTTWPWGIEAARSIFNGWKNSTDHWNALMSPGYRRIGVGVALRRSNDHTYAAAVLVG